MPVLISCTIKGMFMIWTWDVHPVLFQLGDLQIRYYGVFYAIGVMMIFWSAFYFFRLKGLDEDDLNSASIVMIIGLILGAHWTHILFYEPRSIIDNPVRIIEFGKGLASHGGGVGALLALWLYCRYKKVPFFRYCDPIAAGAFWIVPTVRFGNFFNSEIVGRVTDGTWGVIFARRGLLEPRHPSQLYEAAIGIFIVVFTTLFYRAYHRRLRPGAILFMMTGMYAVTRFGIEYYKEYQTVSESFPLTMGQMLSVPLVLFCFYQNTFNPRFKLFPLLGKDVEEKVREEEEKRVELMRLKRQAEAAKPLFGKKDEPAGTTVQKTPGKKRKRKKRRRG